MAKKLHIPGGGEIVKSLPEVVNVVPTGQRVLIENLKPKEVMGTSLELGDNVEMAGAPQAYVIALGSEVPESFGIKVGSRVIVVNKFVPVPNPDDTGRVRGIIEYHNIQAVLEEEKKGIGAS